MRKKRTTKKKPSPTQTTSSRYFDVAFTMYIKLLSLISNSTRDRTHIKPNDMRIFQPRLRDRCSPQNEPNDERAMVATVLVIVRFSMANKSESDALSFLYRVLWNIPYFSIQRLHLDFAFKKKKRNKSSSSCRPSLFHSTPARFLYRCTFIAFSLKFYIHDSFFFRGWNIFYLVNVPSILLLLVAIRLPRLSVPLGLCAINNWEQKKKK